MPTYYNAGDGIEGKKVTCEFRDHSGIRVFLRTRTHRGQSTALDDAYCCIERAYEWVKKQQLK